MAAITTLTALRSTPNAPVTVDSGSKLVLTGAWALGSSVNVDGGALSLSAEGTNGAKTEYCLDKQKQNIERPYRAALKDALRSKHVVEALRALHEIWLSALTGLAWRSGESDADYKTRVARPYDDFRERIAGIRVVAASKPEPAAKPASRKKASAKANP